MRIIILFGPPGVGKGTQAELLSKKLNYNHVSTGEILRAEIKKGSKIGREVEKIMAEGKFASDDLIFKIIERYLKENKNVKGIIFDGFPRTLKQAEFLEKLLEKNELFDVTVVNLTTDNEELIKRLVKRGVEQGRVDDNEETIRTRLEVYNEQTRPILGFYRRRDLVIDVNGVGSVEKIHENVLEVC